MTSAWRGAAVTGAGGFVGGHIVALLRERGVPIRALARRPPAWLEGQIIEGDVRDPAAIDALLDGVDVAFHTAALVTPWIMRPEEQWDVNFGGTERIVAAAERRGIPLVCTGSIATFDPDPPAHLRLFGGDHYTHSKRRATAAVRAARTRGAAISQVVPGGIVGPMDRRPTALGGQIRRGVRDGRPFVTFSGGLWLVDVRDVAEAHLRAAAAAPGEYILPGEYWSLDRLYGFLDHLAGRSRQRVRIARPLVQAGAAALVVWSHLRTHEAPVITPAWVHHFAIAEAMVYRDDAPRLGLRTRPIEHSLRDAAEWFARA